LKKKKKRERERERENIGISKRPGGNEAGSDETGAFWTDPQGDQVDWCLQCKTSWEVCSRQREWQVRRLE
jgi:hypothetical protein